VPHRNPWELRSRSVTREGCDLQQAGTARGAALQHPEMLAIHLDRVFENGVWQFVGLNTAA